MHFRAVGGVLGGGEVFGLLEGVVVGITRLVEEKGALSGRADTSRVIFSFFSEFTSACNYRISFRRAPFSAPATRYSRTSSTATLTLRSYRSAICLACTANAFSWPCLASSSYWMRRVRREQSGQSCAGWS
jgi:hypothetical protein